MTSVVTTRPNATPPATSSGAGTGEAQDRPRRRWPNNQWSRLSLDERFWQKVDRSRGPDDCWPWLGHVERSGYGRFSVGVRSAGMESAHTRAYILTKGPIPDGMQVDHECHLPDACVGLPCPHRICCNPAHLVAKTPRENYLRGNSPAAQRSRQTHCIRDHELAGANLYVDRRGHRHCRPCAAYRARRRYAESRGGTR